MAAAVDWQPPSHRPSMDQYPSNRPSTEHRARSTPPYTSTPSYFPPVQNNMAFQQYPHQPQAWTNSALPAAAFYQGPGNPYQPFPSPQQQHQAYIQHQFHQSQADFAAWAQAYQHMVMAQVAHHGGGTPPGRRSHEELGAQPRRSHEELGQHARRSQENLAQTRHSQEELRPGHRRRTSSGPAPGSQQAFAPPVGYFEQTLHKQTSFGQTSAPSSATGSAQGYHPYKRQQGPRTNRAASNTEKDKAHVSALPSRSVSASATIPARETAKSAEPVVALKIQDRKSSFSSERAAPPPPETRRKPSTSSSNKDVPPAVATSSAPKPSPLSQPSSAQEPTEQMVKSGGLKGRLRRALDKESKKDAPKVTSKPPVSTPSKSPAPVTLAPSTPASNNSARFTSPQSETSTQSSSPPDTPPSVDTMRPPPSMGSLASSNGAMASDVSLADTERTTGPPGVKEKAKGKGLFSMRNPSTDNISLSSTVSSASMMIRRMGALGKLARRNSLMGISRIFKDKPRDGEDGPLPEVQKEDKKAKKERKKAEKAAAKSASSATISRAHAESDRREPSDDRTLAGLSPAAKLARQHTLRSKAEAEAQAASKRAAAAASAKATGEPTWDHNTTTRHAHDQTGQVSSFGTAGQSMHEQFQDDEWDGRGPRVYGQEEYDSADSSEGETVDDVTVRMGGVSVADEADYDYSWGTSYRDRLAKPSRGILKATSSYADLDEPLVAPQAQWNRNRSHSAADPSAQGPGPLAKLPASDPDHIDGHRSKHDSAYDPYSPSFSPFDSPIDNENLAEKITFPYLNAALNTSAPALAVPRKSEMMAKRSQTAPLQKKRLVWAPECAVYNTFASETYDRRSEPATCNRLTPELAQSIKAELNAFKLEMPVHPQSKIHTHFFA